MHPRSICLICSDVKKYSRNSMWRSWLSWAEKQADQSRGERRCGVLCASGTTRIFSAICCAFMALSHLQSSDLRSNKRDCENCNCNRYLNFECHRLNVICPRILPRLPLERLVQLPRKCPARRTSEVNPQSFEIQIRQKKADA